MSFCKQFHHFIILRIFIAGYFISLISSCSNKVVPVSYPNNKPFVYEYKINLQGEFKKDEKKDLLSRLDNQLDDSIHVRTTRKIFSHGLIYPLILKQPPVFDSTNADRSVLFMHALLKSLGYFKDTVGYIATKDTIEKGQVRTNITFNVKPGMVTRFDSIRYSITQPELQKLTDSTMKQSLLKKGDPFAQTTVANELDRLVNLYRENGYMRFTRNELYGLWDTLDVSLLNPTLDPFQQMQMLQRLKEKRLKPTANIEIRLRPGADSGRLIKYYIGNVSVYPDYNQDTSGYTRKEKDAEGLKIVYYRNLFKPKVFPPNIFFHHGDLFDQRKYFKTINRFNALGTWTLVNIDTSRKKNSDTMDFHIRLSPAKKYSFTANLEGSFNQSVISGNLFGTAVNAILQNRNFQKALLNSNINARYGVEFGSSSGQQFIQAQQVSTRYTLAFPRPIPNFRFLPEKFRDNFRTIFSFSASNTERKDLYNLTSISSSWGYETRWNKKSFSVRLPNIEYSYLIPRSGLDTLFKYNPSLKNVFTDGLISSIILSFGVNGGRKNNLNTFNINVEEAGLFAGLIHTAFFDSNVYRFVRVDADFARRFQFQKSAFVIHLFSGVGYEFNSTVSSQKRNNLPFFKQYFAGGPNSMRAWPIRRLGPGSLIKDFSDSSDAIPDRYGDVQLEANLEYRFPFFTIGGIRFNGALFTDIGNVWLLKRNAGPPEEIFTLNRLGKDIAIGAGTGLRVDFGFLVLRLDYSYKVKNPSPSTSDAVSQNKWFYDWELLKGQFQLGISYPFIL